MLGQTFSENIDRNFIILGQAFPENMSREFIGFGESFAGFINNLDIINFLEILKSAKSRNRKASRFSFSHVCGKG